MRSNYTKVAGYPVCHISRHVSKILKYVTLKGGPIDVPSHFEFNEQCIKINSATIVENIAMIVKNEKLSYFDCCLVSYCCLSMSELYVWKTIYYN